MGCGLAALSLAACVAVPVDPRTGQVLPQWPAPAPQREVTVITTPVQAAPAVPPTPVQAAPAVPPTPVAVLYTARLYPANDVASASGTVTATVQDGQEGRGRITVHYRGELLQGEATRVGEAHPGFGRIHAEVLGVWPRQTVGRRGIANAASPGGLHAQCEYLITSPSQGTGVCLFSDGAKFQMHFG